MIKFKAKIKGLDEVLKKIEKYNKVLSEDIDDVLSDGAHEIADMASLAAPQGKSGKLKSSIRAITSVKHSKTIEVGAPYAAYVEFGTGSNVFQGLFGGGRAFFFFTPQMREFASEFYVNGMGKMYARPFLFPAFERGKINIINRIKHLLFK